MDAPGSKVCMYFCHFMYSRKITTFVLAKKFKTGDFIQPELKLWLHSGLNMTYGKY